MLTDTLREIIAALDADEQSGLRVARARMVAVRALIAAEHEPPADVVAVPRTVVLAWAALGDSFDPLTGDGETTFGDESCRLAGKLDAALGLPRGVMWRHTADALRALASAPCAQVADRPVGQVAPAVPAVDPQPVAVAGAATLADVGLTADEAARLIEIVRGLCMSATSPTLFDDVTRLSADHTNRRFSSPR